MSFAEQGGNFGDDRRDVKILSLTDLTLVASPSVPADVIVKVGPPESH